MSRYKIDMDTMETIDKAFTSSHTLQQHLRNNVLVEITALKEQCLGEWQQIFTNRLFTQNNEHQLETVRISNKTYVINDFIYDPTLVRFLGSKASDKDKIPERLLEALKHDR